MLRRLRVDNLVLIREAELVLGPGLNVVTGETGAGKTILTQAIGLLLGARAEAGLLGPRGPEAYVEAELDLPEDLLGEEGAIAELRPADEPGLVAARRVFADGRSRAYAWGRAIAREDLAGVVERLLAMSGQFEQRRLARPSHQLELLDAFAGEGQARRRVAAERAWRDVGATRRTRDEAARAAGDRGALVAELTALVEATDGLDAEAEERLRAEHARLRNAAGLAQAATAAAEALAPELTEQPGAAELAASAERALRPLAGVSPELETASAALLDASERLRDTASGLRGFLASLDAEPGRLEAVEEELGRIGDLRRRFGVPTLAELLDRVAAARVELDELGAGSDPLERAQAALTEAETRFAEAAAALRAARREAAPAFSSAARSELAHLGLGEGELCVELGERDPGPTGTDTVALLIRSNAGMPFAPVATTASGGELSRIALALRVAAHARAGEPTVVFDEIDAGIGGQTAHAVAESLARLARISQVIAITHLPQIASVADVHFRVEKIPGDPTHTRIERLGDDERRRELERMLGGADFLVGAGLVRPQES
ncbi:MAG: AAA family ATPase [Gaiellales bacterium]